MVQRIGFKIWDHDGMILSEAEMERHLLRREASDLISIIETVSSRGDGIQAEDDDTIIARAYAILEDDVWKESIPEYGEVVLGTGLLKETRTYTRDGLLDALDSMIERHETGQF